MRKPIILVIFRFEDILRGLKMLEQLGVQLVITEEDEQDLREGVVDFVSISYYMSWTTAPETAAEIWQQEENPF